MDYPNIKPHLTIDEYKEHFYSIYCDGAPIFTFDEVRVRFKKSDFEHCFYESSDWNGSKDIFSIERSERIDWIKAALEDKDAELFWGWDRKNRRHSENSRVAFVLGNYVVVIRYIHPKEAKFVTAYVADKDGIEKIKKGPKWT